jgi:hypothetical protein
MQVERLIRVSVALLALAACQNSDRAPAPAAPAAPPPSSAPAQKPAASPAPRVTGDLIDRYLKFDKERRDVTEAWLVETKGAVTPMSVALQVDPKLRPLRDKWKISADELHAVDGLFAAIATSRIQWERSGEQQLAAAEKAQTEAATQKPVAVPANATPEQKAYFANSEALRKNSVMIGAKAIDGLKRLRDLTDVRQEYGDAAVDYAIKNGGENVRLPYHLWLFTVAKTARKSATTAAKP